MKLLELNEGLDINPALRRAVIKDANSLLGGMVGLGKRLKSPKFKAWRKKQQALLSELDVIIDEEVPREKD